jgi:hypothetical protein
MKLLYLYIVIIKYIGTMYLTYLKSDKTSDFIFHYSLYLTCADK